jgi:hypothetical protein
VPLPTKVKANLFRREDRVYVDLGRYLRLLDLDADAACQLGRALLKLGEDAKRVGTGHARMTRREVEAFEEAIVSPHHRISGG